MRTFRITAPGHERRFRDVRGESGRPPTPETSQLCSEPTLRSNFGGLAIFASTKTQGLPAPWLLRGCEERKRDQELGASCPSEERNLLSPISIFLRFSDFQQMGNRRISRAIAVPDGRGSPTAANLLLHGPMMRQAREAVLEYADGDARHRAYSRADRSAPTAVLQSGQNHSACIGPCTTYTVVPERIAQIQHRSAQHQFLYVAHFETREAASLPPIVRSSYMN
jgi:hypothetical protein